MKINVITRHAVINYGSVLQSIATQTVLERLGHECQIVDYVPVEESPEQIEKTVLRQKSGWNGNPLKKAAYMAIRQPASLIAGKKFDAMCRKHLNLTRHYSTRRELESDPPQADIYVTGSDQVWGPIATGEYDPAYFLSFAPQGKKRMSIAASMGKMALTSQGMEVFREYLPKYDRITVRETSNAEFLGNMGIPARTVLDPTLMLTGEDWSKYVTPARKDRYVLVYQLHKHDTLSIYARRIADRMGLPLVRVSPSMHQFSRGGKFCCLPDLGEFLSLIKHAAFMVTDSFHGTAFAINFNTPFAEILPDNGTSSRNVSILKLTGLMDRVVTNEEELRRLDLDVDFTEANRVIAAMREESLETLRTMLNERG